MAEQQQKSAAYPRRTIAVLHRVAFYVAALVFLGLGVLLGTGYILQGLEFGDMNDVSMGLVLGGCCLAASVSLLIIGLRLAYKTKRQSRQDKIAD